MMKIYEVIHYYDVDGGFGDAISMEDVVATFLLRKQADEFVEKYSNPHVYDKPYADLRCGYLEVREREINSAIDESEMWWLENEVIEIEDDEDEEDDEDYDFHDYPYDPWDE